MYYDRVLSSAEELYISRAQQRIADLGKDLSQGFVDNNVPFTAGELIVELQYSIDSIKSTFLQWTEDEIEMVMNYYTIRAGLSTYAFREVNFLQSPIGVDGVWATVPQLNAVDASSKDRDTTLQDNIDAEAAERAAEDQALWDAIADSGQSAVLEANLTSVIDLGGIKAGDTFVAGTKLEVIWRALLAAPSSVSNLTHDGYSSIVEVGTDLVATQFSWGVTGLPVNLKLSDSEGVLVNVPVTGGSYTPDAPITYPMASRKAVTWTLSGDGIDPITLTTKSFWKSYSGEKITTTDDIITVSEADILAATNFKVVDTATDITFSFATSNTEQGWIAVHGSQTGVDYSKWFVSALNSGSIASGLNFIQPAVDVLVNGETYKVYTWGYRSPLTEPLKLHR